MHYSRLGLRSRERVQLIDITAVVPEQVRRCGVRDGVSLIFVPHTTAAVTVNENADPSVVQDLVAALDRLVSFQNGYTRAEGNSAAHIKSTLVGCSVQVPIRGGKLAGDADAAGTGQGVWFCEFDGPRQRSVDLQIIPGGVAPGSAAESGYA